MDTTSTICFKLKGISYECSLIDFNIAIGFLDETSAHSLHYTDALCEIPEKFKFTDAFTELTGHSNIRFILGKSKAYLIQNAALRYLHRLLAYSFSGRRDNTKAISKTELFILCCIVHKKT